MLSPAGFRPRAAAALTNCDVADATVDNDERAILGLINTYRAQNGASALSIGQPLSRAATWMANSMATQNYFPPDHVDLLGRDPFMRMADCDVPSSDFGAENISAGYQNAQQVFDQWKASPQHNANMLNPDYHSIGIARAFGPNSTYKYYWVTTYSAEVQGNSAPADAAPPPATAPAPAPTIAACTDPILTPGPAIPIGVNKTVRFTAAITCGGSASFQWWGGFVFPNGDILWQQLTQYGAGNTYDWTPKAAGTYAIGYWAKNAGATPANGNFDVSFTQNYTVK
jgi:uncharacterized protein YkwD